MEVFKLFGSIFVNTDEAEASIQKTADKTEGFASTLGKGIGTAAKWGTAIVGGAAAGATALTGFATKTAETTDKIDKMSQRLGLSKEAYQELDFALSQSGVDINSFQTGMKSLLKNMDAVTEGNATATENFEKLGISVTNADGTMRSQESVLWDTVRAFQGMEDGAEKSRLAQELFGKQGQEIIPLLNSESGSIDEMRQKAHELGLVLSDETINSGVELTDTMDQMNRALGAVGTNLGAAVMPIVKDFAQLIIDNMPMIQELIGNIGPILQEFLAGLLPLFMQLGQELFPIIFDLITQLMPFLMQIAQEILPVISELLQAFLPPLIQIVQAVLPVIVQLVSALLPIISALLPILKPILDIFVMLLEPLLGLINTILPPLMDLLTEVLQAIVPPLSAALKVLAEIIAGVLGAAFETIQPIIESAIGIFKGLIDFITGVFSGDWEKAWGGIVDIFSNIFNGIVNIIKSPMNAIIKGINGVFSKIGTIKIPDWVPGIGGKNFSLPQLPMLEHGGEIIGSGSVIVGEKAPEILDLPSGARVRPLNSNTGTDASELKEALYEAVRDALKEIGIQIQVEAVPDKEGIFRAMRIKNKEYGKMNGGRSAFEG